MRFYGLMPTNINLEGIDRHQRLPEGQSNLPPSAGYQFFGQEDLDGESETLTVRWKDSEGNTLHIRTLTPESRTANV